jgi:hypothetical protein
MIRVVSFVTLTDEGARTIENFADTVAKVRETVTANGGTLEYAWQTAGIYDFVAVLNSLMSRQSSGRRTTCTRWERSESTTFRPSRSTRRSTSATDSRLTR